jgi:hypothetical protein
MRVQGLGFNEIEQSYSLRDIKLNCELFDEGPRPKSGKLRLNLHGTILEAKINQLVGTQINVIYLGSNELNEDLKGERAHNLENQDAS